MKNRFTFLSAILVVILIALGCSLGGLMGGKDSETPKDGTTKTENGSDSSSSSPDSEGSGELVKVGIPECDELATYINDRAETIGKESIVVRGIVEMYKQTIFSGLKESVEKMDDKQKEQTAENCRRSLENLKKNMEAK
jgi:hypothetical protein